MGVLHETKILSRNFMLILAILTTFLSTQVLAQQKEAKEGGKYRLEEVTVTATGIKEKLWDIPGAVTVITRQEIEESGAQSVDQVLKRVPGLNYVDEDGRGLKPSIGLRGLDPVRSRRVMVLVDGKFPIGTQLYGDPAAYYMIPLERVERIEVIRGGASVLYGGVSVGGVINFITKKGPVEPETKISTAFGSNNALTVQTMTGGTNGNLNYLLSGLRRQGDGWRKRSKFAVNDYTLRLGTKLDEASDLTINFNWYDEVDETPGGLTQAQYDANPKQSQHPFDEFNSKRANMDLTYKRDITDKQSISISSYGSYFERNWWIAKLSTTSNSGALRDVVSLGGVVEYKLSKDLLGKENSLILGTRIHADRLNDKSINGNSPTARSGTTSSNTENRSFIYSLYAQDKFKIIDKLSIVPGIRLEGIEYWRDNFVNNRRDNKTIKEFIPGIGTVYDISVNTSLYGNISKGYQPPMLSEALDPGTVDAGNDLGAEVSVNYEIGLRTQPLDWLSFSLAAYRIDYKDQVITEAGIRKNAGNTRQQGLESELELGPWKGLSSYLNGTIQRTEFRKGANKGNNLPYAPDWLLSWGLRYQAPVAGRLVANLHTNWVDDQFTDAANTSVGSANGQKGPIPSYKVWNLRLDYEKGPWSIFGSINNLFDEKYFTQRWDFWNGILPAPDRTFMVGVSVKF